MGFYIYSPIIALVAFSFKSGLGISFPFEGFTLQWYSRLLEDREILAALNRSLQLASVTTVITTPLVTASALTLRRGLLGRDAAFYLIMLGLIVPGSVYGVAAALFYSLINVQQSMWTALPLHVIWVMPFGLIIMLSRFDPLLTSYEQAARVLGCSEWRVFRKVTLPLIYPQVLATALFAFTLSLNELIRSAFVTGLSPTLPVYMFGYLSNKPATPEHYALGTVIVTVSIVLLLTAGFLIAKGYRIRGL